MGTAVWIITGALIAIALIEMTLLRRNSALIAHVIKRDTAAEDRRRRHEAQAFLRTLTEEEAIRLNLATSAMNGLISSEAFHGGLYQQSPTAAAEFAFAVADAMLAAKEPA